MEPSPRRSFRTCPLCEATCGLEILTRGREVVSIRGDRADVFSRGYICPKAAGLKDLEADPDRVRVPMVRRGGRWHPVSWDDAFAEVDRGLTPILREHGRDAVAVYLGNPNVHNLAGAIYGVALIRALGSPNVFTANTVDAMPKQVAAGLMFGGMLTIPVPDVDRTEYLLILGANPLDSNGSLLTAPNLRDRLRAIRQRGGTVVVVDPRQTRTAEAASEHHYIRPGTDAHFLLGVVHTLFSEGLVALGRLAEHTNGVDRVRELAGPFPPEAVAVASGIGPQTIRRIAREFARARKAAVYGRVGTCAQEFGTLTSWLVDVVNTLTGNLDREGGAMFAKAAAGSRNATGTPGRGRGVRFGRWHSRVRGLPEAFGELPAACLAEEMEVSGKGQVRGLIMLAANPVLSTPDSGRLERALAGLAFMVSVDFYVNETTRFAHVLLPPPSPLARPHYDLLFYQVAARNVARYSPPVFPLETGETDEWEILARLIGIVMGQGPRTDPSAIDDFILAQMVKRELETPGSRLEGHEPRKLLEVLQPRSGPERVLDFLLRSGPYGDAFGKVPDGLRLDVLEAHPHGIDLGPLQPRVPEVLRTPSGKIELAPDPIVADVERLRRALDRPAPPLVLIGRRHLKSNNSWMHNLPLLIRGRDHRCTLQIHPDDAAAGGIITGDRVRVSSRVGSVEVPAEVTHAIMRGVVSLPHGWGHDRPGARLQVAAAHAGAGSNFLSDAEALEPLSGTAILNGLPVSVEKIAPTPACSTERAGTPGFLA